MKVFVLTRWNARTRTHGEILDTYITNDDASPSELVRDRLAERGYRLCEFMYPREPTSFSDLNEAIRRDVWFDLDDERFDTSNPVGEGWPKVR